MTDIRFRLDHHQLSIACNVMATLIDEEPAGEALSMLHSIVLRLHTRLSKRLPERRLEYGLALPVHDALALRRVFLGALEWMEGERHKMELRLMLGTLDPLLTRYTLIAKSNL